MDAKSLPSPIGNGKVFCPFEEGSVLSNRGVIAQDSIIFVGARAARRYVQEHGGVEFILGISRRNLEVTWLGGESSHPSTI